MVNILIAYIVINEELCNIKNKQIILEAMHIISGPSVSEFLLRDFTIDELKQMYNQLEDEKRIRESGLVADELFDRGIDVLDLSMKSGEYSNFRF